MLGAEYRTVDKRKIAIDDRELSARLGRLCSHTDPDISAIVGSVIMECEPKYAVKKCDIEVCGAEVILGFGTVKSSALSRCLSGCRSAYVFAVTLGVGVDRLISKISVASRAEAFIYGAVASALIEAVCDVAQCEIAGGEEVSSRFSVGYGDFSLEYQAPLLNYLGAPTYLGITLTDTSFMLPTKTVTAILGVR